MCPVQQKLRIETPWKDDWPDDEGRVGPNESVPFAGPQLPVLHDERQGHSDCRGPSPHL